MPGCLKEALHLSAWGDKDSELQNSPPESPFIRFVLLNLVVLCCTETVNSYKYWCSNGNCFTGYRSTATWQSQPQNCVGIVKGADSFCYINIGEMSEEKERDYENCHTNANTVLYLKGKERKRNWRKKRIGEERERWKMREREKNSVIDNESERGR